MGRQKFNMGERVIGNDKKALFRGRRGVVVGYGPHKAEYFVRFDDGRYEHVGSWFLDREKSAG